MPHIFVFAALLADCSAYSDVLGVNGDAERALRDVRQASKTTANDAAEGIWPPAAPDSPREATRSSTLTMAVGGKVASNSLGKFKEGCAASAEPSPRLVASAGDRGGLLSPTAPVSSGEATRSPTLTMASVEVGIRLGATGAAEASVVPVGGLNFGVVTWGKPSKAEIQLRNRSDKKIVVSGWRVPCDCMILSGEVAELPPNGLAKVFMTLDGEGQIGRFERQMLLRLSTEGDDRTTEFFLPIKYEVSDGEGKAEVASGQWLVASGERKDGKPSSDWSPSPAIEADSSFPERDASATTAISFVDYCGGGLEAHPNATAWVFGGENCPGCNFLKADILPKLFEKFGVNKATVVVVDLDKSDNFSLLISLEDKLSAKPGAPPVLFWENKLYYGNASVKELIENK